MAIKLKCPKCGASLTAPDEALGKNGRCKHCQALFTINNDASTPPKPSLETPRPQLAGKSAADDRSGSPDTKVLSASDVRDLDSLLRQPDGRQLTVEQAVQTFGYRAVWVAALNGRVREILNQRRLHGYPPRVFISYRWEGDEHRAWVQRVAEAFRDSGHEVLFDKEQLPGNCPHMDVPEYVARLADCHYVVMVVTPSYLESDTWVWDEINIAVTLRNQGLTRNIALVKALEGPAYDSELGNRLGCQPDDLFDVRDVADPYPLLRDCFRYAGPRFSEHQKKELAGMLDRAEALVGACQYQKAADWLNAHPQFLHTVELNALVATIYAKARQAEDALSVARDMLRSIYVDSAARLRLAEVFRDCGEYREALETLRPLRGLDRQAAQAANWFGLVLDDLGAHEAARNHLLYCQQRAPETDLLLNNLGVVYRNNGQFAEAEQCFLQALEKDPDNLLTLANLVVLYENQGRFDEADKILLHGTRLMENFDRLLEIVAQAPPTQFQRVPMPSEVELHCDGCPSSFRIDLRTERLCGGCGVVHSSSPFQADAPPCPCCGNDAFVPVQMMAIDLPVSFAVRCPICHQGNLVRGGPASPKGEPATKRRESRTEAGDVAALLEEMQQHADMRFWFRSSETKAEDPGDKTGLP